MCALSTASPQLTASSNISSLVSPNPRQIQQLPPMENHSIQEEFTSSPPPKDSDDCCCCFKEQEDMFVAEVLLSISTRKAEAASNASLPLTTLTPAPSSPEPKDSLMMMTMMMMGNPATRTTTTNGLEENCNSSVLPPFAFAKLTGAGWSYYIQSTSITLGRHQENLPDLYDFYKENHVFLAGSKLISRLHARILFNGGTRCWEFHCIGRNGAFVDGKFCEPTQMACLGRKSLIEIGGIVFYFLLPNLASTNTQNTLENASQTAFTGNSCIENAIEGSSNSINCLNNNNNEVFASEEDHISLSLPSPFSTRTSNNGRPAKSYASLISEAILSVPERKMTLSAIYNYLIVNYPYFASAKNGWQNSIRHNLSLNKAFRKVPRKPDEPGKGMFWMVDTSLILPSSNAPGSSFATAPSTAAASTNTFNSNGGGSIEEREIVNYCRPMYHSVVAAQANDSLLAMSSSPVPTSSSVGPTTSSSSCSVNRIKFRVSPAEKMFS